MPFTESEIKLLLEGLDILDAQERIANNTLNSLGGYLKSYTDSEAVADHLVSQNQESQLKRERIILLKARLVQMKDKSFIDDLD